MAHAARPAATTPAAKSGRGARIRSARIRRAPDRITPTWSGTASMKLRTRARRSEGTTLNRACHPVAHTPFTHSIWTNRDATRMANVEETSRTPNPAT
jgi:hypothetical protein